MGDNWVDWCGGDLPPVDGEVRVKAKFRNGDIYTRSANNFRWNASDPANFTGYAHDITEYLVVTDAEERSAPTTSDGGSSDYYKITIKNKAGEEFSCEMGDIIRAVVDNDFDLGNILKASRRMSLAKQGSGKAGTTVTYDANKIKYFADEFAFWHETL